MELQPLKQMLIVLVSDVKNVLISTRVRECV